MTEKMFRYTLPLLLFIAGVTSAHFSPAPAPSPVTGVDYSSEFIQTCCNSTLYPDLCFTSLAGYAAAVHSDRILLAVAASNVSLTRILAARARVTALSRSAADNRTAAALHHCRSTLGDAADGTRRSAAELRRLEAAAGDADEVRWRVSNAQTWMSAALTNEETCTDGVGEDGCDGEVRADVEGCVGRVKEYTSNALALVNHLVDS